MKLVLALNVFGAAAAFLPSNMVARHQTSLQMGDDKEMSKAIPFVPRPKLLDGSLPGDVGFEYVSALYTAHSTSRCLMTYSANADSY